MPDMTLLGFISHLAGFEHRLKEETRKGMERAAKLVQTEAKSEIGHYQGAAGPFAAWPELADSTKDDRIHNGFSENEPLLRTGAMRDSIEYVVGDSEAAVGSNNDKAVWQELGTDRIPPRSFLGGAAFRKENEIHNILGGTVVTALIGKDVFEGRLPISN